MIWKLTHVGIKVLIYRKSFWGWRGFTSFREVFKWFICNSPTYSPLLFFVCHGLAFVSWPTLSVRRHCCSTCSGGDNGVDFGDHWAERSDQKRRKRSELSTKLFRMCDTIYGKQCSRIAFLLRPRAEVLPYRRVRREKVSQTMKKSWLKRRFQQCDWK